MIIQKKTTIQLIKFAMVGVLNTTLSLVVIYSLMTFFHVGVYTANIWGYVVGVTNSFIWNKVWVFRKNGGTICREILYFLAIFALCYGIQFMSLRFMIETISLNSYVAQLLAMGVYTIMNFILNKCVTFRC